METPILDKHSNPVDTLVEFVELLASIEVTPDKLDLNSKAMIAPDGTLIAY